MRAMIILHTNYTFLMHTAWEKGNAVILEPIMKLEVAVPDEFQVRRYVAYAIYIWGIVVCIYIKTATHQCVRYLFLLCFLCTRPLCREVLTGKCY